MTRQSRFSGLAGALISLAVATSTTHAHAASQLVLPVPACGVAVWGVGSSGSSVSRRGPPNDGGVDAPSPQDGPLVPRAREEPREPVPSPAEGTPLVIVGGAATLAGGIWTTAIVASADGEDGLAPLAASVPVLGMGLVLVGIGLAKWAGPSPYDDAAGGRPLTVSARGVATAF